MTLIQAFILGIIQGLTEFLPISSSAHLVLVPYLFKWNIPAAQVFPFDVLVQLGTLLAVILYFWKDLIAILKAFFVGLANKEPFKEHEARLGWYLLLATLPAGILGMTIKSQVEAVFSSPVMTTLLLFVTAALLVLADLIGKRTRTLEEITWIDALWIGAFQALSIFPGISRSGSTIAGGMTRSLDRTSSARFSFLMSIPVMMGASVVSLKDLLEVPNLSTFLPSLLLGFFAAAVTGYLSIHWLLSFIKRKKFFGFAIYCVLLACTVLLVSAVRTDGVTAATPSSNQQSTPSVAQTVTVPTATSVTGYQLINIAYTPAMEWTVPTMSSCTGVIGNSGLVTHELPTSAMGTANADLIFRWGAPDALDKSATQIGTEELIVVVNNTNPLRQLTAKVSRNLFSGRYDTWGDLYQACPDCFQKNYDGAINSNTISLGFYAKDEDIQELFLTVIMSERPVANSAALLVPDPAAMVQFLQSDQAGIGFIPAHSMDTGLREIALVDYDPALLQQPILVLSNSTPSGNSRELLLCMQNMLNP
jgi:undecaprenyl-diphosphatase